MATSFNSTRLITSFKDEEKLLAEVSDNLVEKIIEKHDFARSHWFRRNIIFQILYNKTLSKRVYFKLKDNMLTFKIK